MITKQVVLAGCTLLVLSVGSAQAGPCNTANKDAGSGPTPGHTGQTIGSTATTDKHPPTDTMNRATGDVAASSQDTQSQMQGQPTVAQQAEGAKPSTQQTAEQDC
jgi:hypothetical protein